MKEVKENITTIHLDSEFPVNGLIKIDDELIKIEGGKVYRQDSDGKYILYENIVVKRN